MKRLLGVDVDLVIYPTDKGWWKYLYDKSVVESDTFPYFDMCTATEPYPYNLGEYYNHHPECYDYWRELDYSNLEAHTSCIEKLEHLSEYFDIVFISSIKGNHTKSKYYKLKQDFPFMKGYMATKEKFLMNNSVVAMIDDRKDILEKFDLEKRVLYSTPYTQTSECPVNFLIESWEAFSTQAFLEYYYVGDSL